jgi:hypothetical protein
MLTSLMGRFDSGERAVGIIWRGGWISPVSDVRALDERNMWEVESLFFVSSNRNSRVVTVRYSVGESGDKFRSDVTLPMLKFEVVTSQIRACEAGNVLLLSRLAL